MGNTTSRILLALDVDSVDNALALMNAVGDRIGGVKIGLELINGQYACDVAKLAIGMGLSVFWDGKFHDIPTTMAKAAKVAVGYGARMVNVHGSAGIEGIRAVVKNKGNALVLVVTVLTSHDTENTELDFGASRNAKVLYYARQAVLAHADGIICSAKELVFLGKYPELNHLTRVVPGTRSPGVGADDQKNIDTPANAVLNGANWLVIGRELTEPKSGTPAEAADAINTAVREALAQEVLEQTRKAEAKAKEVA